jgi:beta-glucuronidase
MSEANAIPVSLIENVGGRENTTLDGTWRIIIDPYEHGYRDYHGDPQTSEAYFLDRRPSSRTDRIEYDFDRSSSLSVPGDWNSQRAELLWYEGTIWYKRSFDSPSRPGRRVFVRFGAANYHARAWLNGQYLGEHVGGFTPFEFELTLHLRERDNSLIVQVNNQRRRDGVPALNTDWWNYGGLTRSVTLIDLPDTFIRDYHLALDADGAIAGWVRLDGSELEQTVRLSLPEASLEQIVRTDSRGFAEFELPGRIELWSPEKPKLYEVVLESDTDRVRDQIGFRRIEVRGREVLLNGQAIFMRGISLHEQGPLRSGRSHGTDDARILLGWAAELGSNTVRLAHYPHDEATTRLADQLGLLVWSEIPVYWAIDWENPLTLALARRQLGEMIARDKNRASVIIWSVGNETPRGPARLGFMTELVRTARALDRSRLVSAALEKRYLDESTVLIDDPLGEELDLIGCNEYVGWYDGLPEKADGLEWRSSLEKPVFLSEFGADALQGHHGDELTRWTEEYQESVYRHQLGMLRRIPGLCGLSPWILADFRSPRRPLPGIQDYWNRKGLISDQGVRKRAFFVLRAHYQELGRGADR